MHLLIRRISEYTGNDLLLGVYCAIEEAERDRSEYLRAVVHGGADPWAKQAYRDVSDDDVAILSDVMHIDLEESAERAFVVSSYAEGFGQVFRSFEAIVGSDIGAREHAKALEAKDDSSFPYHCEIDEVPIGELSRQPGGHRNSEA